MKLEHLDGVAEPADGGAGEADTYDILNAGPRHRFTVSGLLVSNCLYDAHASTISLSSGLPYAEASALLEKWLDTYPGVRDYRLNQPEKGRALGYVELVSGQRIPTADDARNAQYVNAPVQGSAASVMYRAEYRVEEQLRRRWPTALFCGVVHDEILIECDIADAVAVARMVQYEMSEALFDLYPQARAMSKSGVADAAICRRWSEKDNPDAKLARWIELNPEYAHNIQPDWMN